MDLFRVKRQFTKENGASYLVGVVVVAGDQLPGHLLQVLQHLRLIGCCRHEAFVLSANFTKFYLLNFEMFVEKQNMVRNVAIGCYTSINILHGRE